MSELVHIVAILAILQFFFFGIQVGIARQKTGIKAPKMSGDDHFERVLRVQMNTLELLIMFLPALFLAGYYASPIVAAILGAIYLVGRMVFWKAYVADPSTRELGFKLSIFPIAFLVLMALFGAIWSLIS